MLQYYPHSCIQHFSMRSAWSLHRKNVLVLYYIHTAITGLPQSRTFVWKHESVSGQKKKVGYKSIWALSKYQKRNKFPLKEWKACVREKWNGQTANARGRRASRTCPELVSLDTRTQGSYSGDWNTLSAVVQQQVLAPSKSSHGKSLCRIPVNLEYSKLWGKLVWHKGVGEKRI